MLLQELKTAAAKPAKLFVAFSCGDQKRYVHQLVLKAKLPDFDGRCTKIPVSPETFDRVIEFLYKGEISAVHYRELLELYTAAKCIRFHELTDLIKRKFELCLAEYLGDPEFLKMPSEKTAESLGEILEGLRIDSRTKMTLLQRIEAWKPDRSLYSKLFSCSEPHSMYYLVATRDNEFQLRDVVTQNRIACNVDFSKIHRNHLVILGNKLFATASFDHAVLVVDLVSGETLQQIAAPQVRGVTFHDNEIFAWTLTEIFLLELNSESGQHSLKSIVSSSNLSDICIVKRTPEDIIYATESLAESEGVVVRVSTYGAEETVLKSIFNYKLLGTHDDAAFAVPVYGQYYMNIMSNERWDLPQHGNLRSKMCDGFVYTVTESAVEASESAFNVTISKINSKTQSQTHSGIILPSHKFNSVWLIPVF